MAGAEQVTSEGRALIDAWGNCRNRVASLRAQIAAAERDMDECENRLGAWLVPEGVAIGEKIAVWHGDSLIQAEVTGLKPLTASLTIRKRGRALIAVQ